MRTLKQLKKDLNTLKSLIIAKEMYGSLRRFVKIWDNPAGRIDVDDYDQYGEICINGTQFNRREVHEMETAYFCLRHRGLA